MPAAQRPMRSKAQKNSQTRRAPMPRPPNPAQSTTRRKSTRKPKASRSVSNPVLLTAAPVEAIPAPELATVATQTEDSILGKLLGWNSAFSTRAQTGDFGAMFPDNMIAAPPESPALPPGRRRRRSSDSALQGKPAVALPVTPRRSPTLAALTVNTDAAQVFTALAEDLELTSFALEGENMFDGLDTGEFFISNSARSTRTLPLVSPAPISAAAAPTDAKGLPADSTPDDQTPRPSAKTPVVTRCDQRRATLAAQKLSERVPTPYPGTTPAFATPQSELAAASSAYFSDDKHPGAGLVGSGAAKVQFRLETILEQR